MPEQPEGECERAPAFDGSDEHVPQGRDAIGITHQQRAISAGPGLQVAEVLAYPLKKPTLRSSTTGSPAEEDPVEIALAVLLVEVHETGLRLPANAGGRIVVEEQATAECHPPR